MDLPGRNPLTETGGAARKPLAGNRLPPIKALVVAARDLP